MNIQEAKEEISRAIDAYLWKDESGHYRIPRERQRPLLLMGAPGVGKTAIMRQLAEEKGLALVSYTISHHTRQSAIGLPVVTEQLFDGRPQKTTNYTMSEIVASVYEMMEKSGKREGILFLDEINTVSETLAPTMLQFLQYKTFGTHRVPDGWVIVTAGNPPEYNRAVRDFDVVTKDRVRELRVTADFAVWKRYALERGIHGAVLAFLELEPEAFFFVRAGEAGKRFVTARGWEDLSDSLKAYEALRLDVSGAFTGKLRISSTAITCCIGSTRRSTILRAFSAAGRRRMPCGSKRPALTRSSALLRCSLRQSESASGSGRRTSGCSRRFFAF